MEGEPIMRPEQGVEKSVYFLKMLFLLLFPIASRLLQPRLLPVLFRSIPNIGSWVEEIDWKNGANVLSVIFLWLFALLSISMWLNSLGLNAGQGAPLLVNSLILTIFFAVCILILSFGTAVFLKDNQMSLLPVLDLLHLFILMGFLFFGGLILNWFGNELTGQMGNAIILGLTLLYLLYRLMRELLVYPQLFNRNVFFIFFYLCAVEIAPLLIILKIIRNLF